MQFLSVCSGIEAASVAWGPMGWKAVAFSEIEPFPCAVLAHHYPDVPNLGDMTKFESWPDYAIDLLCGGTPCFVGSTLIATQRGLIPIADVVVGDMALTHRNQWQKVLAIGSKDADTVLLRGQGQSTGIETTAEHPFYARKKTRRWIGRDNGSWRSEMGEPAWVPAEKMQGQMWASPTIWPLTEAPSIEPEGREHAAPPMSDAFAWVIGRWLGDGWCRINDRRGYVIICCGKHEATVLAERITTAGLAFSTNEERTTTRFQIANRATAKWLTTHFGSEASTKTIPTWAFGWSLRASLLDGYLSADGCTTPNGMRLTTVSNALALGTVLLAHSLGKAASRRLVHTNRVTPQIEGRTVNERPFWQVSIYDQSRSSIEIDGHRWGLVRHVCQHGFARVYNLEVAGDNSYVADGIVVHNCQSFSVAGLRKGLDDPRGNLMLTFGAIAAKYRPKWLVWENVPGVLSSNGGRDFGAFLGMLGQLGYGFAYRVLDAQYFGVAQRRRRVFVVGCLGDWASAAAVLFERHSLSGHPAPSRKARQGVAGGVEIGPGGGRLTDLNPTLDTRAKDGPIRNQLAGAVQHGTQAFGGNNTAGPIEQAAALNANRGCDNPGDFEAGTLLVQDTTHTLRGEGFDASEDGTGRGTPLVPVAGTLCRDSFTGGAGGRPEGAAAGHFVPVAFPANLSGTQCASTENLAPAMGAKNPTAVAHSVRLANTSSNGWGVQEEVTHTLDCTAGPAVQTAMQVRRLTPVECERLQGFPDGYAAIPWRNKPADQCPDGPRYKALGNSWATPNARWIGERIAAVALINKAQAATKNVAEMETA